MGTIWCTTRRALAFSSLFFLIGAFFRRPAIVAIVYTFFLEAILGNMPAYLKRVSISFYTRCMMFERAQDAGFEAAKAYEAALVIQQNLVQEFPESHALASDLGCTLNNMALIELADGQFEKARTTLRQANQLQEQALKANPRNHEYRGYLGSQLGNLITACKGLGDESGVADAERRIKALRASDPRFADLMKRMGFAS